MASTEKYTSRTCTTASTGRQLYFKKSCDNEWQCLFWKYTSHLTHWLRSFSLSPVTCLKVFYWLGFNIPAHQPHPQTATLQNACHHSWYGNKKISLKIGITYLWFITIMNTVLHIIHNVDVNREYNETCVILFTIESWKSFQLHYRNHHDY